MGACLLDLLPDVDEIFKKVVFLSDQSSLGESSKKNGKKAVRLTAWVAPPPPPLPPPKRSGKCKNFLTSCHIWGYFAIL